MTLRALAVTVGILAALNVVAWQAQARRTRSSASAFVEGALVEPAQLARARRIVVREKPLTKVVHQEEGFQVTRVAEADAPVRETILTRGEDDVWRVASYFDLEADAEWLGRTMSDLSLGRLTRFLTDDPALMSDLGFQGTLVRLEDASGAVIREIHFGRKDGEGYQVVRLGGHEAFVARHEAEILGHPTAWIVTRVLRVGPDDVRDVELPFLDTREPPLVLHRAERGAPLEPALERLPPSAAEAAADVVAKLLAEPLLLAVPRDHPAVQAGAGDTAARLRLTLFDGRRYEVRYGVIRAGLPPLGPDVRNEDAIIMTTASSDPGDVTRRYEARVGLVYTRRGTLDRLPRGRAALAGARR